VKEVCVLYAQVLLKKGCQGLVRMAWLLQLLLWRRLPLLGRWECG
jgi:hypothetical protein